MIHLITYILLFLQNIALPTPPGLGSEYRIYQESASFSETALHLIQLQQEIQVLVKYYLIMLLYLLLLQLSDKTSANGVIIGTLSQSIADSSKNGGKIKYSSDSDANNFCTFDLDSIDEETNYWKLNVSNGTENSGLVCFLMVKLLIHYYLTTQN